MRGLPFMFMSRAGGSRTSNHSVSNHKWLELNVSSYRQPVELNE